jgi:hypothetical protein
LLPTNFERLVQLFPVKKSRKPFLHGGASVFLVQRVLSLGGRLSRCFLSGLNLKSDQIVTHYLLPAHQFWPLRQKLGDALLQLFVRAYVRRADFFAGKWRRAISSSEPLENGVALVRVAVLKHDDRINH